MYPEFPSFTAYLLKKMDDTDPPTLSIGDRVKINAVKRHQPKKWLGRTGTVVWIDTAPGLSEYTVDLGEGKTENFQRHQLRLFENGGRDFDL